MGSATSNNDFCQIFFLDYDRLTILYPEYKNIFSSDECLLYNPIKILKEKSWPLNSFELFFFPSKAELKRNLALNLNKCLEYHHRSV